MRPQKITFGQMRSSGVRGVLIYCANYRCGNHIEMMAAGEAGGGVGYR